VNRFVFVVGVAFGFLLAAGRLNDYDVIHDGLLLRNPYMFEVLASAVAVAMPLLWVLRRTAWTTPLGGPLELNRVRPERKHVLGGMAFGTGWAVAGTCPGPAIAMTVGGGVLGAFVMAGLVTGVLLRDWVAATQLNPTPGEQQPAAVPTSS
jgi:hypothetical protein